MGALLNLYAIFYFKSSSLLVSFGFLGFLVILLLANEFRRVKSLGLPFKFALLSLCLLSFFAYLVPVLVGSISLVAVPAVDAARLRAAAARRLAGRPRRASEVRAGAAADPACRSAAC